MSPQVASKSPTLAPDQLQERNALYPDGFAYIRDLGSPGVVSCAPLTSNDSETRNFRQRDDVWIRPNPVGRSLGHEARKSIHYISDAPLNLVRRRKEQAGTIATPTIERIGTALQLKLYLFGRPQTSVEDHAINVIPKGGKDVRRIIAHPAID